LKRLCLAILLTLAVPLAAKPPAAPAAQDAPRNMEGEAIGYLAIPALLVLAVLIGVLVGGGGEDDMPASP